MNRIRMLRTQRRPLSANDNAPLPLNWRRGLFRIWLLLSIAWVMSWSVFLTIRAIQGEFQTITSVLDLPVLLLGPPAALFVFGAAAIWAFRGFKAEDQRDR